VIPPEIVEETDGDSMKDQENHFYLSVLGSARLINAGEPPMWIKPMRIRLLSRCRPLLFYGPYYSMGNKVSHN
jgi:hypothetical protein